MEKRRFKDRAVMRKRMTIAVWFIIMIFALLIIRLSYIMTVKRKDYAARAEEQWTSEVRIDARRGKILDRNGEELAISANVYRVDFDLNSIRQYLKKSNLENNNIAPLIAEALGFTVEDVMEKLETKLQSGANAGSATLVRRIEKEQADKVKALEISGVIVSPDTKRYYTNGEFLVHALGSTNIDGQGLTGIELQYNEYLSGVPGVRITEIDRNSDNLPYTISKFTPPIDGKDVTTTIDKNIQYFAEKIAEKGLVDNKANRVSILVTNPNTGEILAMVNKPDFNPNDPFAGYTEFSGNTDAEKLQKMWRNSLVNDTFEPGSIFKVVTMIAALEEGVAVESDTFNCTGSLQVGPHTIKCWKTSGHGQQTLPEILQNSCNVGFMKLGEKVGREKLNEYIHKLGFGQATGIDLPGEARGIVKKTEDIKEADLATISFGQTNTVNAIQYMAAYNAIANGGKLVQPHIMKEISHETVDGKVVDEIFTPKIQENILSPKSTSILRDYLERTVNEGGSNKTYISGYHIGAKTGTAQKVNPATGGYESGRYISSIAAMVPTDNPQITVFITIDEPSNGAYYAGMVTTPLAKQLLTDIFNYMGDSFSKDTNAIVRDVIIPEVRGLSVKEVKKIFDENNLEYNIQGDGSIITDIQPYPGYIVKEGSKINLYTGGNGTYNKSVIMPDLRGYSLESAKALLTNLGINYTLQGEGVVKEQSIPQGEVIAAGATVRLILNEEYGD